jgi:hypothetical protein
MHFSQRKVMATWHRNHGADQEPNGINGGTPPSAAREAEAAVYAGLALDLRCGFGAAHNRSSTKPLDTYPTLSNYVVHL